MKKSISTFLMLFLFYTLSAQTLKTNHPVAFDKQGHRGCRGLMPENTIAGMLKAVDLGVTTLELDVVISGDGEVVVSHEPYFSDEITTKGDGTPVSKAEAKDLNIFKMTYAQVKTFDVGLKPHRNFPKQQKLKAIKPLLKDLIDSVEAYVQSNTLPAIHYNIEIKSSPATDGIYHPAPETFVDLLMKVIHATKIENRYNIQSFDFRPLQYLHKAYPQVKLAVLIEGFDKRTLDAQLTDLGFKPTVYSPFYALVNENLIKACHSQGMKIIPWTVNTKAQIEQLKNWGVDGIITDYPNLFNE